jgi:hypothetical protein
VTSPAYQPEDQAQPVPRPRLVEPVVLRDAITEYVAQLVQQAPPLSPDVRARLAGLLSE